MITIVTGRPRSGKGMVCAAIAEIEMRRGRNVCADYFLDGALPWIAWEDCCSPAYAGCVFMADEVGSSYSARETMDLDMLVFSAATMHAKQGVDMYLQAQSLLFVDIQMRRLAHDIIVVTRVGFNGHRLMDESKAGANKDWSMFDSLASLWKRPWLFIARHYDVTDFHDDGELKGTARCKYTDYYLWTRKRAMSYNSQQLVIPDHLRGRFEQAGKDAAIRREMLPRMRRGQIYDPTEFNGIPTYQRVDKAAMQRLKRETQLMEDIVDGRGFYSDGENWATVGRQAVPSDAIIESEQMALIDIAGGLDHATPTSSRNGHSQ